MFLIVLLFVICLAIILFFYHYILSYPAPAPPVRKTTASFLESCLTRECDTGLVCDNTKYCKLPANSRCNFYSDCALGHYCSGVCVPEDAPYNVTRGYCPCGSNFECVPFRTGEELCLIKPGFACTGDSDCVSGLCLNDVCSNLLPLASTCTENFECQSNNCDFSWREGNTGAYGYCQQPTTTSGTLGAACLYGLPEINEPTTLGAGCAINLGCVGSLTGTSELPAVFEAVLGTCQLQTGVLGESCGGAVACAANLDCRNIAPTNFRNTTSEVPPIPYNPGTECSDPTSGTCLCSAILQRSCTLDSECGIGSCVDNVCKFNTFCFHDSHCLSNSCVTAPSVTLHRISEALDNNTTTLVPLNVSGRFPVSARTSQRQTEAGSRELLWIMFSDSSMFSMSSIDGTGTFYPFNNLGFEVINYADDGLYLYALTTTGTGAYQLRVFDGTNFGLIGTIQNPYGAAAFIDIRTTSQSTDLLLSNNAQASSPMETTLPIYRFTPENLTLVDTGLRGRHAMFYNSTLLTDEPVPLPIVYINPTANVIDFNGINLAYDISSLGYVSFFDIDLVNRNAAIYGNNIIGTISGNGVMLIKNGNFIAGLPSMEILFPIFFQNDLFLVPADNAYCAPDNTF